MRRQSNKKNGCDTCESEAKTLGCEIDDKKDGCGCETETLGCEVDDKKDGCESEAETLNCEVGDKKDGCGCEAEEAADGKKIIRLAVGAVVFGAGVILRFTATAPIYAEFAVFALSYALLGADVIIRAAKNLSHGVVFDENFLMTLATAGAFAIGERPEAAGVMLFYQIGELLQDMAVDKSKKTIERLLDIRPDYANLLTDGAHYEKTDPRLVRVGDHIIVKPGEKIPLDGTVTDGRATLDASALTGESKPRRVSANDDVLSGCVNFDGALTIRVTKAFGESTVSKIIDMAENAASKKAPAEKFITKFARIYTPIVVGLAALIALAPPLFMNGGWRDWLTRGLTFLVVSCPCALVISIPLSFFGGIGNASRHGILIKGGNYLEALNDLDIVAFDKTGTLTKGVFQVTSINPASCADAPGLLAAAARAEAFSNHSIAKAIKDEYAKTTGNPVDKSGIEDYHESAGLGVSVRDASSESTILAGNMKLMIESGVNISYADNDCGVNVSGAERASAAEAAATIATVEPDMYESGSVVHVARGGEYMGRIVVSDILKPDARAAISALKAIGIRKTVMLTGDGAQAAAATAKTLGVDEAYGDLLPGHKIEKLEELSRQKNPARKLAFVGDGINDAPVLAAADVGVAMGGLGSDAAIEAADVVLMTDEPHKLIEAIHIARYTRRVALQNIIFAISVKALFLALSAAGLATMWEAVFADVGVALLAVLNAMRIMRYNVAYDGHYTHG